MLVVTPYLFLETAILNMRLEGVEDNVINFAKLGLGLAFYPWQARLCDAVDYASQFNRKKIACVCPNGAGKTSVCVAASVLRWLSRYPAGKVVVTSSDGKQLDSQLMPALYSHRHKPGFDGWEFLSRQIRTPQGGFMLAFSTNEPSRAEGHHAGKDSPLLVVVDEAKSVEEQIFASLDRCSYNVELLISSPGLRGGRFYRAFTDNRGEFFPFEITLKDCPHISEERIRDTIQTYGEENPFTRSAIYGEFMAEADGQRTMVDYTRLRHLIENPPNARLVNESIAFCDFGGGLSENVLAVRTGNKLQRLICWRERDTVSACARFVLEFRKYNLKASQIWGDSGGFGQTMVDLLSSLGWSINRFSFGAVAVRDDVYTSRGAELWYSFGLLVDRAEMVLMDDPILVSQLTTRLAKFDSRARMALEDKEDMRKRGLSSPDRADACVGVFGINIGSWAKYLPPKELDPWERLDHDLADVPGFGMKTQEKVLRELGGWTG
jgi:phage terminase large subunit